MPVVLLAMLLIVVVAAAMQTTGWRAVRGARSQWFTQYALYAADAAIAIGIANWQAELMTRIPIGTPVTTFDNVTGEWHTRLTVMRTGTLSAALLASAERANAMRMTDQGRVFRAVTRYVRLLPPAIPVLGAVTVLGPVVTRGARIDGRDVALPYDAGGNDCGPLRDTASVAAVATPRFDSIDTSALSGTQLALSVAQHTAARTNFMNGWLMLMRRATPQALTARGELASNPNWSAVVISGASRVTFEGSSRHVGLLAIDGDMIVQGTLQVDGLLIVRGAIDASAGRLHVLGALIVGDTDGSGSRLYSGTSVQFAPCIAGRAVTTVSTPQVAPFLVWNAP